VARTPTRTFRRCGTCGLVYLAWTCDGEASTYAASYFFDDYKAQYGKTSLEDFDNIKAAGRRRIALITKLRGVPGTVLDVGCAYGPFLAAAHDAGWDVTGTDVNQEAVDSVKDTLRFPAFCGDFASPPAVGGAGGGDSMSLLPASFDAVTMWFVIEHFADLRPALERVRRVLKPGGIFAFSTPSGAGISARRDATAFFSASPRDHASIWEPTTVTAVLARHGFRVLRIVSTGHHPERFASPLPPALLNAASRLFRLGDTFEVYAMRK
jgi:2-polyprenyl-3-methyl-5-hydroxy-6-metoxy-1,4-benzoquinol methylase